MVESYSEQILDKVTSWILDNQHKYADDFFVTINGASESVITFEVEDYIVKMHLDQGVACELTTKQKNEKVLDWINECNGRLLMREFQNLATALEFVFNRYKVVKQRHNKNKGQGSGQIEPNDNGWDENDYGGENEDMANDNEDENNGAWNVLDGDDEADTMDYRDIVQQQAKEEEMEEQKKFGKFQGQVISRNLFNISAVKAFEGTKFYEQALEAQEYINKNEQIIKGWLNIAIVKEFLTIKIEIDLNFVDITDINSSTLGWNMDEPLILTFSGKESKLLNADTNDRPQLSFGKMWDQGMLEYNCSNMGKEDSYGCKDYIRGMFKTYIEKNLHTQTEETKDSIMKDCTTQKKPVSSKQLRGSNGGIFGNFLGLGKSKVDDEPLSQLIDMGFEIEKASKALQKSNNDIIAALDILKAKDKSQKNKKNDTEQFTVIDRQIVRNMPSTGNPLIKLMFYITDQVELMTSSCFVCLKPLTSVSFKLRTCSNDYCEYTFEESFVGQVYPSLKFATAESHLDLSIASKALFSTRATTVVEPFPTFFLKQFELRTKRGYLDEIQKVRSLGQNIQEAKKINEQNKDITQMMGIFAKLPTPQEMMNHCTDDESLRKYLLSKVYNNEFQDANKAYKMIAYILATNRSTMRQLEPDEQVKITTQEIAQQQKQFLLTPQDANKETVFQERKKQMGSFFAWHGSSLENWYSIMRNGLRNLSNSHMMTAGAAYGQGIYASAMLGTSMGYSSRSSVSGKQWSKACHSQSFIIGVVEIINKQEYKKDPQMNICVITDEADMLLRYIILYNNYSYAAGGNSTEIEFDKHYYSFVHKLEVEKEEQKQINLAKAYSKYVLRKNKEMEQKANIEQEMILRQQQEEDKVHDQKLESMKNKISGKGSAMATERIMIEYKGLMRSKDFKDILSIDFKQNNMYNWQVLFDLTKYEIGADLKEDFRKWSTQFNQTQQIEYEIIFADSYPYSPPFVRVVRPRFMYQTGHITVGGSICMESLTSAGWSSARSLESYFVEILLLLNIGNAKLDLRTNQPYTLYEAKEAFQRVAKQHGWEK